VVHDWLVAAAPHVWALVLAGGPRLDAGSPLAERLLAGRPRPDVIIAADGGLGHARRLALPVDVVVGDLDSATTADLSAVTAQGSSIEQHSPDKDATDLELAMNAAVERGATRLTVAGIAGGRADHHLANVLLLAHERYRDVEVDGIWGGDLLAVVRGHRRLAVGAGAMVTLLPVGGPAVGVSTEGLRWPLVDDTLIPGTTWGVSNIADEPEVGVGVRSGVVVAVVPDLSDEPHSVP